MGGVLRRVVKLKLGVKVWDRGGVKLDGKVKLSLRHCGGEEIERLGLQSDLFMITREASVGIKITK